MERERRPGRSVALSPPEARLAAWAHLLPPFGSAAVHLARRPLTPALRRVLLQAHKLGGGLLALLVGLSLLANLLEGESEVLLGIVGFLFLVTAVAWVGLSGWLAWRSARGRTPLLA